MITDNFFILWNIMLDKKFYNEDDLADFFNEVKRTVDNKFKELNTDKDIIHPTEQEYKEIYKDAINKLSSAGRCLGIYLTGKNKGNRCEAAPRNGSRFCLKHRTQDPDNKHVYETDPKILKEAMELLEKTKLENK